MNISKSFFGYNQYQVDRALAEKDEKIKQLTQEVATIQKQLDEFIAMEQALKDGIVDARLTGNKIVEASNVEADKILKRTNDQVAQYKEEFAHNSHELIQSGTNLKALMKQMQSEMQQIVQSYQEMIADTDFESIYPETQIQRFTEQVEGYETLEIAEKIQNKKKLWDNTSITEAEKKELKNLIHEVIANEKQESLSNTESKVVKFSRM